MQVLYNILFTVFFWLSAPFYFLKMWRRGQWRVGFGERFGFHGTKLKQALSNRETLWIHAVSVGEVNISTHLIQALERDAPNLKVVVSTTTSTGMAELRKKLPAHIGKIYYPVDFGGSVLRALNVIHPRAIVLVEAEIWPNFLWRAFSRKVPVFLVNARLSERSFRGYRRFGFLFRPIFARFTAVGCQNEEDAVRLRALGFRPEAVHVVGNLKFDSASPLDSRRWLDIPGMLRQMGVPAGSPILVAGSTHAGEEKILGEIFLRLRKKFPGLFLILVPRHFERGKEVGRDLEALPVKYIYRNLIREGTRMEPGEVECLVVNTTGELRFFYEHATVIFVGKSLTADGGQNPIEPGALGKPMIFGPNMQNFESIAKTFVEQKGALQVRNAAELEAGLERLFGDPVLRRELGQKAEAIVRINRGGIDRTTGLILECLGERSDAVD